MIAKSWRLKGLSGRKVFSIMGLSSSSYYYHRRTGKRGRRTSLATRLSCGKEVSNQEVVEKIREFISEDFHLYGYIKITHWLTHQGYIINKKKVYRLMKRAGLMLGERPKSKSKKNYVCYRKLQADRPLQHIEMDIKYIYLPSERRNVYLLTVIDVFSRKALGWKLARTIRKWDVIKLMDEIMMGERFKGEVTVRTDNGSQFSAEAVRNYLSEAGISQEFTHIATPQENAHIEAFHSIIKREIVQAVEFTTMEELYETLCRFYKFYNEKRLHSGIGYRAPDEFLREYYSLKQQGVA